ncbi:MAG: type II CAAX endopeptidase family protein [Verrucomicrobiota bacterium]|jgi:membrane protease YdiL (CAAX protease family)
MRLLRSLLIYSVLVFAGGALLAPWLFWFTQGLAAHGAGFAKLAASPFPRFVDRALLGAAVLGLWPLLRSCGILRWRDLGLKAGDRPLRGVARGFLLGFGSLACVALLAVCLGGRSLNSAHSGAQILRQAFDAGLAAIIVSILEEIMFRGALFGILRKMLSWPMALVLSSAVYAVMHFLRKADAPGPVDWLSGLTLLPKMFSGGPPLIPAFFTLFVAGAVLALAYRRTGALFVSIGLHAGWIFWLKFYGFLTVQTPEANPAIWGTSTLIDGWLALPVLGCVFWMVSRIKIDERGRGAGDP